MDYKEMVEKVIASQPWTKTQVEKVFDVELNLAHSTGVVNSFVAKKNEVNNGLKIEELELRVDVNSGETVMVAVDFTDDSACIPFKQVTEDYPGLDWTESANPTSPDSRSYFTLKQDWGKLSFGFKQKRPDCLSNIIFAAKEFL